MPLIYLVSFVQIFNLTWLLAMWTRAGANLLNTVILTSCKTSQILALNYTSECKTQSRTFIWLVSFTRIHSINVGLLLKRRTATETQYSLYGLLGPTTEPSSQCVYCRCGFSSDWNTSKFSTFPCLLSYLCSSSCCLLHYFVTDLIIRYILGINVF